MEIIMADEKEAKTDEQKEAKEEKPRMYRTVVIDTLNSLQNDLYLSHLKGIGRVTFDEWKDYAVELLDLYNSIKSKAVIVQVLGVEGSGKTVGAYYLDPETTLYINADDKPLTFPKPHLMYNEERKNIKIPPKGEGGYSKVKQWLEVASNRLSSEIPLVVFCLAHIEIYKDNEANRQRMKTVGKMATKLNVEGSVIHSYYSKVDPNMRLPKGERYKFMVNNSGYNTARSPMDMWKVEEIPNNFNLILHRIYENFGAKYDYQNKEIDKLDYTKF